MLAFGALILSMSAIAFANVCPNMQGKVDFEPEKFSGDWYYAAYTVNTNRPWTLSFVDFNVTVDEMENQGIFRMTYIFHSMIDGRDTYHTMNAETISPDQPGLFYSVGKRSYVSFWSDVFEAAILDTDYENYAVAVLCAPVYNVEENKFKPSLWGYIWSRSRSLQEKYFSVLKNTLIEHGIQEETIKDTRERKIMSFNDPSEVTNNDFSN